MWGQNKPVVLSYGRPRSRWSLPPWLVLLILGAAAGAAGVIYVQEKHLPPRLSASASTELRTAYEQAEAERSRLAADLAETTKKLDAALADSKRLADDLAAARDGAEKLRQDLEFTAEALPPDPRGGVVEVRAARMLRKGAALAYEVALTRSGGSKPMNAVVQLAVAGTGANGAELRVVGKPLPISIGSQEVVRGTHALPDGFVPRQTSITVLDRPEGRQLGMRVMLVK
ncbi:hypothetical protein [uncultured Piscinibacter sp.]|uniref:hypothetical protein n=1 Tax=uncultured Piscinibacter sp. TaxID=1131835 RepID=UPI002615F107|nr:hypothetical protein [uncultured Piscinibacter sp.]